MDRDLKTLCTQLCKLYGWVGTDKYGKDKYQDTPVMAYCHVDGETKEIIRETGAHAAASGTVYLAEIYPWLDSRANMYVPDLADPSGWRWVEIMAVNTLYDDKGPYAQVVIYGVRQQSNIS